MFASRISQSERVAYHRHHINGIRTSGVARGWLFASFRDLDLVDALVVKKASVQVSGVGVREISGGHLHLMFPG